MRHHIHLGNKLRDARYVPGTNPHSFYKSGHGHHDKMLERSLGRHRDSLADRYDAPLFPAILDFFIFYDVLSILDSPITLVDFVLNVLNI